MIKTIMYEWAVALLATLFGSAVCCFVHKYWTQKGMGCCTFLTYCAPAPARLSEENIVFGGVCMCVCVSVCLSVCWCVCVSAQTVKTTDQLHIFDSSHLPKIPIDLIFPISVSLVDCKFFSSHCISFHFIISFFVLYYIVLLCCCLF